MYKSLKIKFPLNIPYQLAGISIRYVVHLDCTSAVILITLKSLG